MSIWDDLFGSKKDPSKEANKYLDQIPGTLKPYYDPYINKGRDALDKTGGIYDELTGNLPTLQEQLMRLLKNPGDVMNEIGKGYKESPGYQRKVEQAMGASNRAAAAGGMLGSNAQQEGIAGTINDIASEDYNDYLDRAMKEYETGLGGLGSLFGEGLGGLEGLNKMGFEGSNELAQSLANLLATKGKGAYENAASQNQSSSDLWKKLFQLGGTAGGWALGGPMGGAVGGSLFS
jgi:hypothetical protein